MCRTENHCKFFDRTWKVLGNSAWADFWKCTSASAAVQLTEDEETSGMVAGWLVAAKIANCRAVLQKRLETMEAALMLKNYGSISETA